MRRIVVGRRRLLVLLRCRGGVRLALPMRGKGDSAEIMSPINPELAARHPPRRLGVSASGGEIIAEERARLGPVVLAHKLPQVFQKPRIGEEFAFSFIQQLAH